MQNNSLNKIKQPKQTISQGLLAEIVWLIYICWPSTKCNTNSLKMKKLLYTTAIALLLGIIGCKQTEPLIKPRVSSKPDGGPRLTYYLPQNSYRIQIKVLRTQLFRGPYVDFAQDYMRIERDIIKFDETNYEIIDAQIDIDAEADPAEQYSILLNNDFATPIALTQQGIISGINSNQSKHLRQLDYHNVTPNLREHVFTDLSVSPIVDIKETVKYEYQKIDSALVRVPVEKVETKIQSFQQLAWAAAKFISTIRESRFRLLAGLSEIDQIPEDVQSRVLELNKLERRYLELFIGYKITDTLVYNYKYTPTHGTAQDQQEILAWFTKTGGVQNLTGIANDLNTQNNKTGIELKCTPIVIAGNPNKEDVEQIKNKGIVYRVPSQAAISIKLRDKTLISKQYPVSQWGTYAYLPLSTFTNGSIIEFDVYTGNIQHINNVEIMSPTKNK